MSYELIYQSHANDRDLDHKAVSDWLNANGVEAARVREVAVYRVGDTQEIHARAYVRGDKGLKVDSHGQPVTEHVTKTVTVPLPDSLPQVTTCRVCGATDQR